MSVGARCLRPPSCGLDPAGSRHPRGGLSAILVTVLTVACVTPALSPAPHDTAFDLAAARTAIQEKNAAFTRAHVEGDIAAIDAMFTRDATSLPPGAHAAVGVDAIHALTAEYLKAGVMAFSEETTEFYGTRDLLIDRGTYVMTYGADAATERGKYLNVWVQEDGTWKIRTNIWNAGPPTETTMDATTLHDFARRYTAAWCSQDAASVAAFFGEQGSLTINAGAPAVGRAAITASAQGFMTAFPDMVVTMDSVGVEGGTAIYRWTLTGTNTGPGGTGRKVRISGYEAWTLGADGLIARSLGHFDEAEFTRQLGK